jgi:predicted double-glycine peptidase
MAWHSRLTIAAGAAAALAFVSSPPAMAQARLATDSGTAVVRVMTWRDIPFRTVVRQQHDFSCGSAALATLLTYGYGRPTTESDTFTAMYAAGDQPKIRQVGFSLLDMKHYAEEHGFRAQGYRVNLEELAKGGAPVIALITIGVYRHFVVIKGVEADRVLIGDPALGLRIVPRADFEKIWNGVILQIEPKDGPRAAKFNVASEWSPWSRAPLRRAVDDTNTLATVTANQFILYQITPVIEPSTGSGG